MSIRDKTLNSVTQLKLQLKGPRIVLDEKRTGSKKLHDLLKSKLLKLGHENCTV